MKNQSKKFIAVFVVFSVFLNLLNIQDITAYYNDTETSRDNSFSATLLDFTLTNNNLEKIIGPEALGEISHTSVAIPENESLAMQYDVSTTIDTLTSDSDFCSGLVVEAKLNGISKYIGPLPELANAVTTEFGSWEFRFDLPPTVSIPNNVKCNASVLFSAWREDIVNKADSGWHDEETLNISLTSRMVVLNEIYARPNSIVAPKNREYIELYNNSNAPVDVLGWQISEIAGTTETFYLIVAVGAVPGEIQPYNGASTIIPVNGFLILEFGGNSSHLNDGGDTVKLYDSVTSLLDSHNYPGISAGKSVVRFPDGIGFWVDPEATPGATNMVSMEDLRLAGFDEETIEQILALVAIKDAILLSDKEEVIIDEILPPFIKEEEEIKVEENKEVNTEEVTGGSGDIVPEEVIPELETAIEEVDEVTEEEIVDTPPATKPEEIIEETEIIEEVPISEVIEPKLEDPSEAPVIQTDESVIDEPEDIVEVETTISELEEAQEEPVIETTIVTE